MVDLDKLPIVNGKDTNALSQDLKKLVVQFEKKPKQLSEVDQQYVKKFGFAALANSLMYIGTWKNFKFSNSPRRAKIIPEMKEEFRRPMMLLIAAKKPK